MKTALLLLTAAAFVAVSTSCDKHSWDSTQVLHEGMHKDHGGDHKDDHGKAEHGKEAAHGEKPAEAAKH